MSILFEGDGCMQCPEWHAIQDQIRRARNGYEEINRARIFQVLRESGWGVLKGYPKFRKSGKKLLKMVNDSKVITFTTFDRGPDIVIRCEGKCAVV